MILLVCFLLMTEKNDNIILSCSKMNEVDQANLADQTKYRLNEITKTENNLSQENNQTKLCTKQ